MASTSASNTLDRRYTLDHGGIRMVIGRQISIHDQHPAMDSIMGSIVTKWNGRLNPSYFRLMTMKLEMWPLAMGFGLAVNLLAIIFGPMPLKWHHSIKRWLFYTFIHILIDQIFNCDNCCLHFNSFISFWIWPLVVRMDISPTPGTPWKSHGWIHRRRQQPISGTVVTNGCPVGISMKITQKMHHWSSIRSKCGHFKSAT